MIMNATRFSGATGSEYLTPGRPLNDVLEEVQMEPWQEAAEDVETAAKKPKEVRWEVVRNIANRMTNQLYLGGPEVDIEQAHMSTDSYGGRNWTLEEGRQGDWRNGWWAFDEEDVSRLELTSAKSGSGIEATKKSPGVWTIRFIPSPTNPGYKGCYWGMFEDPQGVKNIDPKYVYES